MKTLYSPRRFYPVETLFNGTLALAGRDQEILPVIGSSTEGESGPKIRPKGVVDGQQVNIPVLPLVGPEGRRRLVLAHLYGFHACLRSPLGCQSSPPYCLSLGFLVYHMFTRHTNHNSVGSRETYGLTNLWYSSHSFSSTWMQKQMSNKEVRSPLRRVRPSIKKARKASAFKRALGKLNKSSRQSSIESREIIWQKVEERHKKQGEMMRKQGNHIRKSGAHPAPSASKQVRVRPQEHRDTSRKNPRVRPEGISNAHRAGTPVNPKNPA
eukprot:Gb_15570 [translate_table: standard]